MTGLHDCKRGGKSHANCDLVMRQPVHVPALYSREKGRLMRGKRKTTSTVQTQYSLD